MNKPTGFHVRHDLQPILTYELLTLLRTESSQSEQSLQAGALLRGYKLRQRKDYSKLFSSLYELDLLTGDKLLVSLSNLGQSLARIVSFQRDLLPEYVHFLYYASHDIDPNKRFSWSYRTLCDAIWEPAPCAVNRDKLVNLVTQAAAEQFQTESVSFSSQSVAGILNWIEELNPRVLFLQDGLQYFKRREYCPVELFMLALNHAYQYKKNNGALYVSITDEFKLVVCRICLITPESFSDMLVEAETCFKCVHVRRERGDNIAIENFSWAMLEE